MDLLKIKEYLNNLIFLFNIMIIFQVQYKYLYFLPNFLFYLKYQLNNIYKQIMANLLV